MKKRIQVTINSKLVDDARHMMSSRGFDSFSEFLESLIREETDRRQLTIPLPAKRESEAATKYPPPVPRHATLNEGKKKK